MTFGLDTSVVLRLLTGEPQELAAHALERYQRGIANGDDFAVSDVVAAETYYALQHHYNKTKEESLAALMAFSGGEGIFLFPRFHDRMLVSGYTSKGQVTLSCEKSFRRLAETEVISCH